jgi:putative transposase
VPKRSRPALAREGQPYARILPRPYRTQIADGLYHLTTRANYGRLAFRTDDEREQFLGFVAETIGRHGWSCRAYCVLSTHYHLFLATPEPDLAAGMQYLKGRYAQWANWSRKERGHLFEGRYRSVLVESPGHALEVQRYVALNPVRAGLAARPEDWRWSSTRALFGLEPAPPFLDVDAALEPFGPSWTSARRRLRSFVQDSVVSDTA